MNGNFYSMQVLDEESGDRKVIDRRSKRKMG
jgi:hypothetical protein